MRLIGPCFYATPGLSHPDYSGTLGYIAFKNFLETSESELNLIFEKFNNAGVTDLILDLRYNGGGRTRIANLLASKIAGPYTNDKLSVTYQYNIKYTEKNFSRHFATESGSLGLSRLIAITGGATASASELVINSLKPYIEVITIGTKTKGKPFISIANTFCGLSLNAMEAQGVNANGVSVAGGITADCYASDDLTHEFGLNTTDNSMEGMLRSAADYLVFGSCNANPLTKTANTKSASTKTTSVERQPGLQAPYISERAN